MSLNALRLQGKVAIVTGAGQGIGCGIAQRFAQEGARVVIAEINRETVYQAAEQIGPQAYAYPVDIGDTDQIQQMIAGVVARFGRLDILINNAGVSERVPFLEVTPAGWDHLQRVNQRGLFFCLQAAAKQMIAQIPADDQQTKRSHGKIVNLSSIAGRRGRGDAIHYSVSKAAVITITQGAALALAPYNINVNAICPSVIPTPMWDELDRVESERHGLPRGEFYRQRVAKIPLKRSGTVEEIAAMTTFLCSDEADYITGQTYNVDGGSELN